MDQRTDVHRPSVLDPAEYEDVGYTDHHHEEGGSWWEPGYPGDRLFFDGAYTNRGGCDHCGHHSLRYVVHYLHKPTGKIVSVGETCAGKLSLSSRNAVAAKREIERQALQRKVDAYKEAHPEVSHFLESVYEGAIWINGGFYSFLMDLRHKLIRYGELSEKQTAVVEKAIVNQKRFEEERAQERANEPEPAPVPVTDERIQITGKIVSVKLKEDEFYGDSWKMKVLDDRGFKVWGTRPESLLVPTDPKAKDGFTIIDVPTTQDMERHPDWVITDNASHDGSERQVMRYRPAERGDRVTFMAKVTVSEDDETFGFFKRPTKAEVID